MKNLNGLVGMLGALGVIGSASLGFGATSDYGHNVTVNVGTVLDISYEDDPNITLEFLTDFAAGAVSSTGQTIVYTVRANDMPNASLPGAISAMISSTIDGIDIAGEPGDYINQGTSANATLVESATGFITIGTAPANLFDKPASSGVAGKLLKGKAPIHYRAIATRDLTPGDGGMIVLTVTLKDA